MSAFADSRRRLIARFGRAQTLTRPAGDADDLTVTGVLTRVRPDTAEPPLQQGDGTFEITDDERAAADWPEPDVNTIVLIDDEMWAVKGAQPVYDGATCIGWTLWVRGGAM